MAVAKRTGGKKKITTTRKVVKKKAVVKKNIKKVTKKKPVKKKAVRKRVTKKVTKKKDVEAKQRARSFETTTERTWQYHPYRSFVEGLPVWLAILTIYMFSVVYLQSWTFALIVTLLIVAMGALLLDVLHQLHRHLQVPSKQRRMYDSWLTNFGRGLLVGFSVFFLILFLTFAFSFDGIDQIPFVMGSILTLIGIGLIFFLVLSYIALIVFIGFPRVRHQLSLALLLFFCYFYLFFAFAVRRIEL